MHIRHLPPRHKRAALTYADTQACALFVLYHKGCMRAEAVMWKVCWVSSTYLLTSSHPHWMSPHKTRSAWHDTKHEQLTFVCSACTTSCRDASCIMMHADVASRRWCKQHVIFQMQQVPLTKMFMLAHVLCSDWHAGHWQVRVCLVVHPLPGCTGLISRVPYGQG